MDSVSGAVLPKDKETFIGCSVRVSLAVLLKVCPLETKVIATHVNSSWGELI